MRIYRFMSIDEFKNYLECKQIVGKFVKGKACFLEENIPAREKEESIKQLTDLKSLRFKSDSFDGQMKELSELISPTFKDGNFDGELKNLEQLTLTDFMSKVRENASAEVLVEFETKEAFDKKCEKVIMAYQKYLIEEIQSDGYSKKELDCISYKIDLINEFRNGVGVDTVAKKQFENVEQALSDIEKAKEEKNANSKKRKEFVDSLKVDLSKNQGDRNDNKSIYRNKINEIEGPSIDD